MWANVLVEPGRVIGERYALERPIGKGSMGEVWLARHVSIDASYAVKLIDTARMPDAAGRFQMEALIAARLSKKTRHVVTVTDHGEEDELAYLVMQLLDGESLEERITRAAPMPLGEVSEIVTQIGRALAAAHAEGFIHRDVKPGNIFLTHDEDGQVIAKLLDFGIARTRKPVATRSPFVTAKDTIVGTPSYMSPEQARASDELDDRTDLWSLAVVAYEALTGALPFEGESLQDVFISIGIGRETPIRERRADLPEAITTFYAQAFAAEVEDRFPTAHALAHAFSRVAGFGDGSRPSVTPPGSVAPVPPGSMVPRTANAYTAEQELEGTTRAERSGTRWLVIAGLITLVLVAASVLVVVIGPPRSTPPAPLPPHAELPAARPPETVTTPLPERPVARPTAEPRPRAAAQAPRAPEPRPEVSVAPVAPPPPPPPPPVVVPPQPPPRTPAPARSVDRSEVF